MVLHSVPSCIVKPVDIARIGVKEQEILCGTSRLRFTEIRQSLGELAPLPRLATKRIATFHDLTVG